MVMVVVVLMVMIAVKTLYVIDVADDINGVSGDDDVDVDCNNAIATNVTKLNLRFERHILKCANVTMTYHVIQTSFLRYVE